MASETSYLRAQVWGAFLQAVAFGIYAITCGSCFGAFFTTRSRQRGLSELNWPMLVVFLIFLAKTTSSIIIRLYLNLEMVGTETQESAAMVFRNGTIQTAKSPTIMVQTMVSSGVLIYRCWLVYGRTWFVVVPPLILWLGGAAVMGIVIHIDTTDKVDVMAQSRDFGSAFWAIVIAVNILVSSLIARRVRRIDHVQSRPRFQTDTDQSTIPTARKPSVCVFAGRSHDKMEQATRIIIESGLIYTTMTLITFSLWVANSVALDPAMDLLVQIIGISFNLIVIRNSPPINTSESSLSNLNGMPLQFVSSNMSMSGSAIEFAFPKSFMPRRKIRPSSAPAQDDIGTLSIPELPHNHSQQSIKSSVY